MSHSKARSRKHLTQNILTDLPEPGKNELVVRVMELKGNNIVEAEKPRAAGAAQELLLCRMPAKFNKLIWMKRGSFLIVEQDNASGDKGKVKYQISHVLQDHQVKHLKKKGLWPEGFEEAKSDSKEETKVEQKAGDSSAGDTAATAGDAAAAGAAASSNSGSGASAGAAAGAGAGVGTASDATAAASSTAAAPAKAGAKPKAKPKAKKVAKSSHKGPVGDGSDVSEEDEDDALFRNPNRRKFARQESSSDEDDEED